MLDGSETLISVDYQDASGNIDFTVTSTLSSYTDDLGHVEDNTTWRESLADTLYSPLAGSTSLITVGTIGTGTWQGDEITDAYISNTLTCSDLQAAGSVVANSEVDDDLTISESGAVDPDALNCDVGNDNLLSEDCIGDVLDESEIEDIYVLIGGDQMTGVLDFATTADNITLSSGGGTGSLADNSTCTIIYSPDGTSRLEVCN